MAVISMSGVKKRFSGQVALDGLHFTVEEGQIHGFLGPNGAGKSTTLRILLGLVKADQGEVTFLGRDPWRDAVTLHRRVAYVPGDVTLWPNLTGGETIDLLGRLHGSANEQRRDSLIERFGLDPSRRARTYSKGNRQKVILIAAFAADADVLLLDEPTSGLDPLMEEVFRDLLIEEQARGRSVVLSSHLLDEVERLCSHVTIIRRGVDVESGEVAALRHLSSTHVDAQLRIPLVEIPARLGVTGTILKGNSFSGDVDAEHLDDLMQLLAAHGIFQLSANAPSLEEIFLRYYESKD